MYKRWLPLLLILLCLTAAPALGDNEYVILRPSTIETQIAPGRDFYVVATVPKDAQSAVVRLINDKGEAVREITGGIDPTFFTEYEHLNAFNTDQAVYQMPDLIYDSQNPDSLYDGSIKCYMKDGVLLSIVPGGQYKMDGHDIIDAQGVPYPLIEAGEYTVEVIAGGVTLTTKMTFGTTDDKVMARFSPDGHLSSVAAAAKENDYRTYRDPLPGYWSPSGFIPGLEGNKYFAEILDRWRLADAMEYMGGTVHFYIYNLSPTSATLSVELGTLQVDGAVDVRMKPYHYDIGEPLLAYTDEGSDIYLMGKLVPFGEGDKLVVTRGEITGEPSENFYLAYSTESRPIDLDVYDGISVPKGRTLTLFGVVCPIQNAMEDMTRISDSAWTTGNRVTEIEYTFTAGDTTWTERHEVMLTRMLAETWRSDSLYEFAHCFTFDSALAGRTITASIQGYDAHGAPVPGTAETISILVTE